MTEQSMSVESPAAFETALEGLLHRAFEADIDLEGAWECSIEDGPNLDIVVSRIGDGD